MPARLFNKKFLKIEKVRIGNRIRDGMFDSTQCRSAMGPPMIWGPPGRISLVKWGVPGGGLPSGAPPVKWGPHTLASNFLGIAMSTKKKDEANRAG